MSAADTAVFWFRRDLRLQDNAGLFHALTSGKKVQPVFIFDTGILNRLPDKKDRRVDFIHRNLVEIDKQLRAFGSSLKVFIGDPVQIFPRLLDELNVSAVFCNRDHEPTALQRDRAVEDICTARGVIFSSYKDQTIFDRFDVMKDDGTPYTVFTPYMKKWRSLLTPAHLESYSCESHFSAFAKSTPSAIPSLDSLGFEFTDLTIPPTDLPDNFFQGYSETRNIPSARQGTSGLSIHLRFGTVSIRGLFRRALGLSDAWSNELIWREFYMMILFHFPHVVNRSFKPRYDAIRWENNAEHFERWCNGTTGFPIVDAGMRELNQTGFMHNRVRMITASFLVKHLLVDWRWGESYFAAKLNDFELSSNNGGWQWAASSGCDAAPYFRVFNPYEQTRKFDPEHSYIRKWVPEYEDPFSYPAPVVDHVFARNRVLQRYKEALGA